MKMTTNIFFGVILVVLAAICAWNTWRTHTTATNLDAFATQVVPAIRSMDGALGAIYKNNPSLFAVATTTEEANK